jgi:hypothetical protein
LRRPRPAAGGPGTGLRRHLAHRRPHPQVLAGLGLHTSERIVGFLYVGSFEGERRTPPALEPVQFVSAWQG